MQWTQKLQARCWDFQQGRARGLVNTILLHEHATQRGEHVPSIVLGQNSELSMNFEGSTMLGHDAGACSDLTGTIFPSQQHNLLH